VRGFYCFMTEFIVGDDDALRSGRKNSWSGSFGVALCGLMVISASQFHSSQAETTRNDPQTVEFSQVMECRAKAIFSGQEGVSLVQNAPDQVVASSDSACAGRGYAPVALDAIPSEIGKTALQELLKETPMQTLADALMVYSPVTRALTVGIAKQESDWGRHAPRKSGRDCYNYWGYKGAGGNGSVDGYACFSDSDEAVAAVAGRIDELVRKGLTTPQKMLVWKCGSSCAAHDPAGVTRWVSVVDGYYRKVLAV